MTTHYILKNYLKYGSLVPLLIILIFTSCKKEDLPSVSTIPITDLGTTSAICGGNIQSDGGSQVTSKGVCWSLVKNPTISDSTTNDGHGMEKYISYITGLTAGSTYHIRAYATNSVGTAYGNEIVFVTLGQLPTATTFDACCITTTSATINGKVNANNLPTAVMFEYGATTAYGNSTVALPGTCTGNSSTCVTADLAGLTFGSTYHFRVKAENALGTVYGDDISFETLSQIPSAITQPACSTTVDGIQLNGVVSANYLATTVTFEYGMTEAYGNFLSAVPYTVTGDDPTNVSTYVSGLNSGTTYHFRIKAENAHGTTYGTDMIFTTFILDLNGNVYQVATIGNQIWMAENLKTTKYSNGDRIANETDGTGWLNLKTGAYCWYNNDPDIYMNTCGALYNWYAIQDQRNICPTGWHVPSDAEWSALTSYLGGENSAGGKLKETGTVHWLNPNTGAINETGFTAIPGGCRYYEMTGGDALFYGYGSYGYWWSVTESDSMLAWYRCLAYNSNCVIKYNDLKNYGFSVRCLKNQ